MSGEIVVYCYFDPGFSGDLGPALDELRRRGHRVVKGDNVDELLFLLQVGRPVAVIYTLATAQSTAGTAYQMVSRRVLDLLVPLILVGPDNPRDGVSLLFPEGRAVSRHHVPLHALSALIERFAEAPPGTPSRPPEMLQNRTMGRGRTVLNWQAAVADARLADAPDTAELHQPPPGSVSPSRPAPLPPQPPPDTKTIRMLAPGVAGPGGPASSPPSRPSAAPVPAQVSSGKRTLIVGSVPPPRPDEGGRPEARPAGVAPPEARDVPPDGTDARRGDGGRRGLVLALVFGLLAVLGAVGIAVWLANRPGAPPPRPLAAAVPVSVPAPAAVKAPGLHAGVTPRPAVDEEPGGEVERPAEAGSVASAPPSPPATLLAPGVEEPFPAHFREGTALFWFDDDSQRDAFLARLADAGTARRVRLAGHATEGEVAAGRGSLGLSRAWAVRRWLIRQGIDGERILTARGRTVPDRGPFDARGFPLNQWVTITIE